MSGGIQVNRGGGSVPVPQPSQSTPGYTTPPANLTNSAPVKEADTSILQNSQQMTFPTIQYNNFTSDQKKQFMLKNLSKTSLDDDDQKKALAKDAVELFDGLVPVDIVSKLGGDNVLEEALKTLKERTENYNGSLLRFFSTSPLEKMEVLLKRTRKLKPGEPLTSIQKYALGQICAGKWGTDVKRGMKEMTGLKSGLSNEERKQYLHKKFEAPGNVVVYDDLYEFGLLAHHFGLDEMNKEFGTTFELTGGIKDGFDWAGEMKAMGPITSMKVTTSVEEYHARQQGIFTLFSALYNFIFKLG